MKRGVTVAVSAVTGKVAAPGELRTISREEVRYSDFDLATSWGSADGIGPDSIDAWLAIQVSK
jgi:hypothetical protein